jgi:gluconate 2-dehydrogenase gamma chain
MSRDKHSDRNSNLPDSPLLSRRNVLKGAGLTGAALVSGATGTLSAQPSTAPQDLQRIAVTEAFETLTAAESSILEALTSRIIPNDDGSPGAYEARAIHYIDRALAGALMESREQYTIGLQALDEYARQLHSKGFSEISAAQQDAIIEQMAANETGIPALGAGFFSMVRNHTIDGTFSDPYYGGNRNFVGWDMIGYPGVRVVASEQDVAQGRHLTPNRQSVYDLPTYTKDPVRQPQGEDSDGD